MNGQYVAALIVIIMALVNTTSVIAQSQNETNGTVIGENQSVDGNISAFGIARSYGPRTVGDPTMDTSELDITLNETELKQNLNATES